MFYHPGIYHPGKIYLCLRFQVLVEDAEILKQITFIDTPGVLSGDKQRISRGLGRPGATGAGRGRVRGNGGFSHVNMGKP